MSTIQDYPSHWFRYQSKARTRLPIWSVAALIWSYLAVFRRHGNFKAENFRAPLIKHVLGANCFEFLPWMNLTLKTRDWGLGGLGYRSAKFLEILQLASFWRNIAWQRDMQTDRWTLCRSSWLLQRCIAVLCWHAVLITLTSAKLLSRWSKYMNQFYGETDSLWPINLNVWRSRTRGFLQ